MPLTPALIVGHYSHDTLIHANGSSSAALGGSAAYVSSVFSKLEMPSAVISKVGSDFAYFDQISHLPKIIPECSTTQFISDFTHGERIGRVGALCESIFARDLPESGSYEVGLAVGIVGEVLPETIAQLARQSRYLLCDIQGLIRTIDSKGRVVNCRLEDTPFHPLVGKISFLKASRQEAESLNLQQVRHQACVLVTEGKEGCTVYHGNQEFRVPAYSVEEIDPTGAGDCFLAGFAAGILQGLPLERAVLLGNYFGAQAVQQVGIPRVNAHLVFMDGI